MSTGQKRGRVAYPHSRTRARAFAHITRTYVRLPRSSSPGRSPFSDAARRRGGIEDRRAVRQCERGRERARGGREVGSVIVSALILDQFTGYTLMCPNLPTRRSVSNATNPMNTRRGVPSARARARVLPHTRVTRTVLRRIRARSRTPVDTRGHDQNPIDVTIKPSVKTYPVPCRPDPLLVPLTDRPTD